MALEDLIAEASRRGLRVNGLAQLQNGVWRANVRTDARDPFHEFGEGPTAAAAFEACLAKVPASFAAVQEEMFS